MHYNHVIFWYDYYGLYEQSFSDLYDKPYARFITTPAQYLSDRMRAIYYEHRIHPRVNRMISHLFANRWSPINIWYPAHFKNDFDEKKDIVFIFSWNWLKGEFIQYIDYLKANYPRSRYVLFCTDLWQTDNIDACWAKSKFDLILSFDQNDCEKYGFTYHPLVFSQYHGELKNMPKSDVYFLGQPKDRFCEIISCLEKMWEKGVTTDVQLVNVALENQVYKDKISYTDQWVPYRTNLQHFLHANCVLELMQHGGVGYTQRMCEAIAFDKKIITNNALIHKAPFYNSDYIFQIKKADDITPELCSRIKKEEPIDYHYKEQISPVELLEFIENHLG